VSAKAPGLGAWVKDSLRLSEKHLLFLGAMAGIVGQSLLDRNDNAAVAAIPFAVLALVVWRLFRRTTLEPVSRWPAIPGRVRWWLMVPVALLGGLAAPRFADNTFSATGTRLWLAGLCFVGVATWWPRVSQDGDGKRDWRSGVALTRGGLALLAFMAIGAFYRLLRIDEIPLEMGCDLPHIYNNIRLILRSEFLVFFPSHPGREGLFFYLAAPLCRVFGLTHTTIKISSALIGVATIPWIYLLGREMYNREVGLWAAFLLSISHWHVILTRVGFRSCTMPLMLVLTLYLLVRACKTRSRWLYAWSGLSLGLGLYTYNAFLIVPLVVGAMMLVLWLIRGKAFWRDWDGYAVMALTAIYVCIPLARYAWDNPQQYLYRVATRVTSSETAFSAPPLELFRQTMTRSLLMFNHRGDAVFINNVPFVRELGFGAAILFVVGLVYALLRLRRGYNAWLVMGLLGMLLPTALSLAFPGEVPNAGRALGALPFALILAAAGLTLVRRRVLAMISTPDVGEMALTLTVDDQTKAEWRLPWGRLQRIGWSVLLLAALVAESYAVYPLYFEDYVRHLPESNYSITLEMARAIDDFADDGTSYIKVAPYWYDGNAVRAQLRVEDQSWNHEVIRLEPGVPPLGGEAGKFMVIVHPDDQATVQTLREAYPQGVLLRHYRTVTEPQPTRVPAFYTFYGERR